MEALPPELLALVYRISDADTRRSLFWVSRRVTSAVRQAVTTCTMVLPNAIFTKSFTSFPHLTTIRVTCDRQQAEEFFGPTDFVTLAGSAMVTLSSGLESGRMQDFQSTCRLTGPEQAHFNISSDVEARAAASVVQRCPTLVKVTFHNTSSRELSMPAVQHNTLDTAELKGMSCDLLDGSSIHRVTATGDITNITFGPATSQLQDLNLELKAINSFKGRYDNLTRLVVKTVYHSFLRVVSMQKLQVLALVNVDVDMRLLVDRLPVLENVILHNSRPTCQTPGEFIRQCHGHPRIDFLEVMFNNCFMEDFLAWAEVVDMVTRFRLRTEILHTSMYAQFRYP